MLNRREFATTAAALAFASTARAQASVSWRLLATEPYQGKQDDISFVSPDAGWYGNGAGKLYATQDGGESWRQVWEQRGTFIRALGFVDERVGFLGNVGVGYYPNVTDTRPLYRTEDGGATWAPVEAPGADIVSGICGIDIVRERRVFQGELRDVAIVHAAGRVGGPATMLRSLDGGASWSVVDLRMHAGMILDVKFFDAQNGLVCAASSADIAQANALVLQTGDGGVTWREVYRSTRPFENCWKMSFPTREVGYATVQSYAEGATQRVLIKTTDGGASWRELPLIDDARARAFGVGFVDESWGWIGASTGGFETRDGGLNWTPIEMGRAVNKIRVLRDGPRVRAFAIGVQVHRLDA